MSLYWPLTWCQAQCCVPPIGYLVLSWRHSCEAGAVISSVQEDLEALRAWATDWRARGQYVVEVAVRSRSGGRHKPGAWSCSFRALLPLCVPIYRPGEPALPLGSEVLCASPGSATLPGKSPTASGPQAFICLYGDKNVSIDLGTEGLETRKQLGLPDSWRGFRAHLVCWAHPV